METNMTGQSLPSKVILVEFNELTPNIMFDLINKGLLPNFKRFHDQSQAYTTDANESGENLNPWVQWVTVHSGLDLENHKVFKLSDGYKLKEPCIWDLVSQNGGTSLICGSMNCSVSPSFKGALIPDPWSTNVEAKPEELNAYLKFVRNNVQEHTAASKGLTPGDIVRFMAFMATHGLSMSTIIATIKQIASERLSKTPISWKRVNILDRFQLDLFKWYFKKLQPSFSTFFLNSTAHLQHRFWRNMDPGAFESGPERNDLETANAIPWGYIQMDKILGEILDLAPADTTVIFCTALSQQPHLKHEKIGGKRAYRLRDWKAFLKSVGVTAECEYVPIMSEEFSLRFKTESEADHAEAVFRSLRTSDTDLFYINRSGLDVHLCCAIRTQMKEGAQITSTNANLPALNFSEFFYQLDLVKSGSHHPHGMFWVRQPGLPPYVEDNAVPLTQVAPTILSILGINIPAKWKSPLINVN